MAEMFLRLNIRVYYLRRKIPFDRIYLDQSLNKSVIIELGEV